MIQKYDIESCKDKSLFQVHYNYLRPWKTSPNYLLENSLYKIFYSSLLDEIYRSTDNELPTPTRPEAHKEPDYYELVLPLVEGNVSFPLLTPKAINDETKDFPMLSGNHNKVLKNIQKVIIRYEMLIDSLTSRDGDALALKNELLQN